MKYLLNTSCVQSTEVNRKFVNVGKTEPEAKVEQWVRLPCGYKMMSPTRLGHAEDTGTQW